MGTTMGVCPSAVTGSRSNGAPAGPPEYGSTNGMSGSGRLPSFVGEFAGTGSTPPRTELLTALKSI
ncbi:MAG: hypothetical protein ACRENE_13155 [Polyangiaceae bacterium]